MADDPSQSTPAFLPPLPHLLAKADEFSASYRQADPFPHAAIDGLIDVQGLREVAAELPRRSEGNWTTWDTSTELKHVFSHPELFGPAARRLSRELNATEFVRFLERLTGINGLIPDPHLKAAGYFDVPVGGFLAPHLDFSMNRDLGLVRRVNVLVYLNENWSADWGGQLELWRTLDEGPVVEIVPELGRLVVFNTPEAPHGHPKPVSAPGGRSRLCFSAYYFSSPLAPDAPTDRAGVRWPEKSLVAKAEHLAEALVPPAFTNAWKRGRREVRRRRALQRSDN